MGNSTLPTVSDKLNIMASIHNRKLIVALVRELHQRDSIIDKFEERIGLLEQGLRTESEQQCRDIMYNAIGWILDVTVERNAATLWIKTTDGAIIRFLYSDKYQPSFYILPKDGTAGDELFHVLSQQPKIRVEWQNKLTDIFDQDGYGRSKLLCIYPESTYYFKTSLNRLQRDPRVAQLFSTSLTHIQNYLFTRLKIEPTCKVQCSTTSLHGLSA
jgi:hypothetical protein